MEDGVEAFKPSVFPIGDLFIMDLCYSINGRLFCEPLVYVDPLRIVVPDPPDSTIWSELTAMAKLVEITESLPDGASHREALQELASRALRDAVEKLGENVHIGRRLVKGPEPYPGPGEL